MKHIVRWLVALFLLFEVGTHSHWSVTVLLSCAFLRQEIDDWRERRTDEELSKLDATMAAWKNERNNR